MFVFFRCLSTLMLAGVLAPVALQAAELPENFAELSDDVQAVILEYTFFSEKANQVWGDDYEEASVRTFVKYLDDYHTRVHIDFERGKIRVESERSKTPLKELSQAIVATLLTPADPGVVDLYTAADMGITGKPFLAGQVLDQDGKSIESQWRAERFAGFLLEKKLNHRGARYWVDIPMSSAYRQTGASNYRALAMRSSQRYHVPVSLIMAVMETESSFNPFAVSHAGAYGLMQVMRATAGRDVYQRIYGRNDSPDHKYLLNPANNVDAGTAYLSILRDVYLRDVQGTLKQEYCMIAAYNGGAGNLLKAFHSDRKKAVERINQMSAADVYRTIVRQHPKDESRRYLQKVTEFRKRYASW
ncbi:murein transglycosylase domain-containing protein [Thalassolituus sp. LLYu03]|uniref:murein transglycosylase domain-containing protein n=1 Tax=Thalassolituus sp. LLYu03 TaxID=3421656 RepID=UPI003D2A684B